MATSTSETAPESAITKKWQTLIKDELEPDTDKTEQAVLLVLRDLLLAPDSDDHSPVQTAAHKLLDLYRDTYPDEYLGYERRDDKGASAYIDCISRPVVELASLFKWDSASHQRLADTMIAVRDGCAEKFNEQDPQLNYTAEGILLKVDAAWNAYSIGPSHDLRSCELVINMTALFAKLFGAGLFDGDLKYVLFDLDEGLTKTPRSEGDQSLYHNALEARAATWFMFGGAPILAQVTRENDSGTSEKQFPDVFNGQNWKTWVNRLGETARDAPEEAEFDLKRLVSKAHDCMVEAYPEVRKQDE